MHRRHAVLALALALGACGDGRVSLEEGDPFGVLRTGAWMELDVDGTTSQRFVASTVPELCDRLVDAATDLRFALQDRQDALEDAVTETDVCVAEQAFQDAGWKATKQLLPRAGANVLVLRVDDLDDDPTDPPDDGDYEVGDLDDPTFTGALHQLADNPYRLARKSGDCAEADALEELGAANRFVRTFSGGNVSLERRALELYRLDLTGQLAESDGDDGGMVDLRGRFAYCALTIDAAVLPLLWLFPTWAEPPAEVLEDPME